MTIKCFQMPNFMLPLFALYKNNSRELFWIFAIWIIPCIKIQNTLTFSNILFSPFSDSHVSFKMSSGMFHLNSPRFTCVVSAAVFSTQTYITIKVSFYTDNFFYSYTDSQDSADKVCAKHWNTMHFHADTIKLFSKGILN